ncbi:MAG TPA: hypothetical protein VHW03_07785, partial [Chthoniobacterales bacterium]|nr:hypothetical protein [Chthoniobacterales bacterium]
LAEKYRPGEKSMVACAYAGTVGVPALFGREYFSGLRSLGDEEGAKKLLLSQPNDLVTVEFSGGAIDIDTPADLAAISGLRRKSAGTIP